MIKDKAGFVMKRYVLRGRLILILVFALLIPVISLGETDAQTAEAVEQVGLECPHILSVSVISKNDFLVKIKRVKKADGYCIYNIEDDGTIRDLKTVKGNKNCEFVVGGLKYSKKYKLTVSAYINDPVSGQKIMGPYDEKGTQKVLKVKTKKKNGLIYYYDMDGKVIKNVESFLKKRQRKYLIKVNTERCVVTIYAKDGNKGYRIPVRSFLCSPGVGTKSGSFFLGEKFRYRSLFYNTYSQWTAVIHGNILFHTTPYKSYGNNDSLDVSEYNKLGTSASHGCIRMQCIGVKWIYDNCKSGTRVIIYKSKKAGPFGKPKLEKVGKWHKWDPTDPTAKKKCRKHRCVHRVITQSEKSPTSKLRCRWGLCQTILSRGTSSD